MQLQFPAFELDPWAMSEDEFPPALASFRPEPPSLDLELPEPELLINWPIASSSTNADSVFRIVPPLARLCSPGPSAIETYLSPIMPLVLTDAIASVSISTPLLMRIAI